MTPPPIIADALARAAGVAILDFEASCLPEPGSYPLEVGVCICATGETASWMIRPTAGWLETGVWDTDAEAIHGITREQAITEGQPPAEVLAALLEFVGDREVLSDSPSAESFWLRRLAAAAGQEPPFAVGDLDGLLASISTDRDEIEQTQEVAAARFPGTHRAAADARHLAEMVRILAGIAHWFDREAINPTIVDRLRQDGLEADFDFDPPKLGNEVPDLRQRAEEIFASVDHSMKLEGQEVKDSAARERLLNKIIKTLEADDWHRSDG